MEIQTLRKFIPHSSQNATSNDGKIKINHFHVHLTKNHFKQSEKEVDQPEKLLKT